MQSLMRSPQTTFAQTTLAILLGASSWPWAPEFEGSQAFTQAASDFRNYLLAKEQFGLPKENFLDLFDTQEWPGAINLQIREFLDKRCAALKKEGSEARNLLFYFVGHGGFHGRNSEYYLAIYHTLTENPSDSGLRMETLAATLTEKARHLRRIIILDCCYAAAAFSSFQAEGPDAVARRQTVEMFQEHAKAVGKGTALLCSSGRRIPSRLAPDRDYPLFSHALVQVLATGNPEWPNRPFLNLKQVAELVERKLGSQPGGQAPHPEVHSPDQTEGDVAEVELFPNPAYKKDPDWIRRSCEEGITAGAKASKAKQYQEALEAYDRVIMLDPTLAFAHFYRGEVLHNLKQDEQALAAYDEAIKLSPKFARAHNGRGEALYALEKYPEAVAAYNKAVDNEETNTTYRNNLERASRRARGQR